MYRYTTLARSRAYTINLPRAALADALKSQIRLNAPPCRITPSPFSWINLDFFYTLSTSKKKKTPVPSAAHNPSRRDAPAPHEILRLCPSCLYPCTATAVPAWYTVISSFFYLLINFFLNTSKRTGRGAVGPTGGEGPDRRGCGLKLFCS